MNDTPESLRAELEADPEYLTHDVTYNIAERAMALAVRYRVAVKALRNAIETELSDYNDCDELLRVVLANTEWVEG